MKTLEDMNIIKLSKAFQSQRQSVLGCTRNGQCDKILYFFQYKRKSEFSILLNKKFLEKNKKKTFNLENMISTMYNFPLVLYNCLFADWFAPSCFWLLDLQLHQFEFLFGWLDHWVQISKAPLAEILIESNYLNLWPPCMR